MNKKLLLLSLLGMSMGSVFAAEGGDKPFVFRPQRERTSEGRRLGHASGTADRRRRVTWEDVQKYKYTGYWETIVKLSGDKCVENEDVFVNHTYPRKYPDYEPVDAKRFVEDLRDPAMRDQALDWFGEFNKQFPNGEIYSFFIQEVEPLIQKEANFFQEYTFQSFVKYSNQTVYGRTSVPNEYTPSYDCEKPVFGVSSIYEEPILGALPEECRDVISCKIRFLAVATCCHGHKCELTGIREYLSRKESVLEKAEKASSDRNKEEEDRCEKLNERDKKLEAERLEAERIATRNRILKLTVAAALTVAGGIQAVRECRNPGTTRRSLENAVKAVCDLGATVSEYGQMNVHYLKK